MVSHPKRDEVWLVALDPSRGAEIKKTRPCLVVSADDMNEALETVLAAPMTTTQRNYPTRVNLVFRNKTGQVALDQLRTVAPVSYTHLKGQKLERCGTLRTPAETAREKLDRH